MDGDCVDRLSSEVVNGSAVHNLLETGVRTTRWIEGHPADLILVLCDKDDAEKIYPAAEMLCPEAAPSIRKEIDFIGCRLNRDERLEDPTGKELG